MQLQSANGSEAESNLTWRITSIGPSLSFRNFFETVIVKSQICDRENLLTGVFVGKSKILWILSTACVI